MFSSDQITTMLNTFEVAKIDMTTGEGLSSYQISHMDTLSLSVLLIVSNS